MREASPLFANPSQHVRYLSPASKIFTTSLVPHNNLLIIPSAKSIFAFAFNGSQLYAGGSTFYEFGASSDITQCSGNANNGGAPKLLMAIHWAVPA